MFFRRVIALAIAILISTSITSQAQQQVSTSQSNQFLNSNTAVNSTYNPSFGRLSLQFGSGVLFGAGGGAIVGLTAGAVAPNKDEPFAGLRYLIGGFYFGYATVSSLGVYLIANSNNYDAQFGNILLGHGIGAAAGIGALALSDAINITSGPAMLFALASPVIGGMISNSMGIQKRPRKTSALLNITDRNTVFSAPLVQITEVGNQNISRVNYSPTVRLLNISL